MTGTLATALLIVLGAGLSIVGANDPDALQVVVPFDYSRGLVEVAVTVNDSVKGVFALDTGADRLYVDKGFAMQAELAYDNAPSQRPVQGFSGADAPWYVGLHTLAIGPEMYYELLAATAINFDKLSPSEGGLPDGVLGHDFLNKYITTIDYPGRQVILRDTITAPDSGAAVWVVPMVHYRHYILVPVILNGADSSLFAFDIGTSNTSLPAEAAERIGLRLNDDGMYVVERIEIAGGPAIERLPVTVSPYQRLRQADPNLKISGVIGGNFLSRLQVTIDYPNSRLIFQRP